MLLPSSFLTFYGNIVVSYHNISADYFPQAKNVVYLFLNWVCIPFSILNSLRFRSGYVQRNPDFFISRLSRPAELVGARPLHLLTQTARRLKAPLGLSLRRKRGALQTHFHGKGRYGNLHFPALLRGSLPQGDSGSRCLLS